MPTGGAAARARQSAILGQLSHKGNSSIPLLLPADDLRPLEETLAFDDRGRQLHPRDPPPIRTPDEVPTAFMGAFLSHAAECYHAWTQTRPENNLALVQPYLEKTLDLSRQLADFFPSHDASPIPDRLLGLWHESFDGARRLRRAARPPGPHRSRDHGAAPGGRRMPASHFPERATGDLLRQGHPGVRL